MKLQLLEAAKTATSWLVFLLGVFISALAVAGIGLNPLDFVTPFVLPIP